MDEALRHGGVRKLRLPTGGLFGGRGLGGGHFWRVQHYFSRREEAKISGQQRGLIVMVDGLK